MDNTRKPTVLTDLPHEILLMISEDLSSADIACLTLCSRHLMYSFIQSAFQSISNGRTGGPGDDIRIDLLSRLSRDLPQYYLCYGCLRLHTWENIERPNPLLQLPACCKSLPFEDDYLRGHVYLTRYPSYSSYRFHFAHLHLAMRRFYYGPKYGIPVDSFFYTEVGTRPISLEVDLAPRISHPYLFNEEYQRNHITELISVEARICTTPPSLCLGTQELAVGRKENISQLFPNFKDKPMIRACRHSYESQFPNTVYSLIARYSADQCSSDPTLTKIMDQGRCWECNTSYKVEIRDVGEKDLSFVLTV